MSTTIDALKSELKSTESRLYWLEGTQQEAERIRSREHSGVYASKYEGDYRDSWQEAIAWREVSDSLLEKTEQYIQDNLNALAILPVIDSMRPAREELLHRTERLRTEYKKLKAENVALRNHIENRANAITEAQAKVASLLAAITYLENAAGNAATDGRKKVRVVSKNF